MDDETQTQRYWEWVEFLGPKPVKWVEFLDRSCQGSVHKIGLGRLNCSSPNLWFRFVASVSSNDDHPCHPFRTIDHHSYNRTNFLNDNIFNKLLYVFLMHGLLCHVYIHMYTVFCIAFEFKPLLDFVKEIAFHLYQ